ncbi:MAG TPA: tRNA (adenosine(37)-N6)-threonylcarbamoyltransferase complex ATPase subunit type 1 TsaE [Planctomycetota bacterium]|jgi:tRNA threonylcarbamoyladenosine biosynthesis protein TsaE|nr:tRNA (adenosine(37)-N6)-threonylcarbamoyltransferase complex ATPase subunit type 1 TsaE [Planctomycetota bacterium]
MPSERVLLPDVEATQRLARRLAGGLRAGSVVALTGELGAGKTELTRGLARALGLPAADVCSPSYLLLNLYRGGRLPVAHFDAYFMQGADDLERAGLAELLAQGCVAVVEWADRVAEALPADALWVALEPGEAGAGSRVATLLSRDVAAEDPAR